MLESHFPEQKPPEAAAPHTRACFLETFVSKKDQKTTSNCVKNMFYSVKKQYFRIVAMASR